MIPKQKIFFHMYYIAIIILIMTSQVIQNLDFNSCLPMKSLFIPNYLQRYMAFFLLVYSFDNDSKATFSQNF